MNDIRGSRAPSLLQMAAQRIDVFRVAEFFTKRYGPVHTVKMFGRKWITVGSPELAREILLNRDKSFNNSSAWSRLIGPFFHGGIMLMDGTEHRKVRRTLNPSFSLSKMQPFENEAREVFSASLRKLKTAGKSEVTLDFYPFAKKSLLEVSSHTVLGESLSSFELDSLNADLTALVRASGSLVRVSLPGSTWRRGLEARRRLESKVQSLVENRIRCGDSEATDVLSTLACRREELELSVNDISNQCIFFLMASHDTVSTVASTMAWALAGDASLQQRVRSELVNLKDGSECFDSAPTFIAAFREASRLWPPVPILPRSANRNCTILGHSFNEGDLLFVPLNILHRHQRQNYLDSASFDLQRDNSSAGSDGDFGWNPFGMGAHRCIGEKLSQVEMALFFKSLLENFTLSRPPGSEFKVDLGAIPRPRGDMPLVLTSCDAEETASNRF